MKRRIAAPEERCQEQNGQHAIWKARRLGRPVEAQCSRKRIADSPYCIWHQPDRVETKRRIPGAAVLDFLSARSAFAHRYGLPPENRSWWPHTFCAEVGIPTQLRCAAGFGINANAASRILDGQSNRAAGAGRPPPPPRARPGKRGGDGWSDRDIIAWVRTIACEHGEFPTKVDYDRIRRSFPGAPCRATLERWCMGDWRTIGWLAAVPQAPKRRHDLAPETVEAILSLVGTEPTDRLAARFGLNRAAVQRLVAREGESINERDGMLSVSRAALEYGIPRHRLYWAAVRGEVPSVTALRGRSRHGSEQRFIFLDPTDIETWLERRHGGLLLAGGSE